MIAQCQACGAPSRDAFLCGRCVSRLRQMLADLPWWIDRLAEAAVGQVRHSDGSRSAASEPPGLKGDDEVLARCRCGHPEHELSDVCGAPIPTTIMVLLDEPDDDGNLTAEQPGEPYPCGCREYAPVANQFRLQDQFLAAGGVNARASRLTDKVGNALTTIVRDLCESRGAELPSQLLTTSQTGRTGVALYCQLARWLSGQISAIAANEGAGQIYAELHTLMGDDHHEGEIGRVVNRPVPMRWLGRCPTWVEDKRAACGFELRCRQDAAEVYCPRCRQVHNPDRLQLLMMNDLERKKLTWEQLLKANRMQPEEFQVKERELRRWRQLGKLKPRGYRRGGPDGSLVISRHSNDDVPLYLWPDVRRLRGEQGKVKTG